MQLFHLYSGNLYGGVERVLVTLAATPGTRQRFGLFFDGRLASELRQTGARVDVLGPASLSRPWTIGRARRAVARVLEDARPDVVLAHSMWAVAIAGRALGTAAVRRALWLHTVPDGSFWPDGAALRVPLDLIFANSAFTAQLAASVVRVDEWIHPPVAPPDPSAAAARERVRHELGVTPDGVAILQAGRIERGKGLITHLEALAQLGDLPQWVAWIAGAPQRRIERAHEATLRRVAAELGIESRVRFLGHRDDVASLMAAADIYCQPTDEPEAFGVSLVEAMGANLPIVTSRAGGLADAIAGVAGLVVETGNAEATAAALRELVTSRDLRERYGREGAALAHRLCDPARQAARLHALLGTLQDGR